MRKIIIFLLFLVSSVVQSQQLNCTVTVNAQKMTNPNQQVYKTLQSALTDFVNKTDWTGQVMKQNEKINCSIYITLLSGGTDEFSGTIQVQSSRPVFDSTFSTPIFNFNDKDFNFRYTEFENLIYNPNSFDSNLVSVISFYCNVILGLDADSFAEQSGTPQLEVAQNIANIAQQGGYKGWTQSEENQNRYFLINDLLSPTYSEVRIASFNYNTALDGMSKDLKVAKEKIKLALLGLNKVHSLRPNAFLTRVFFDAKSDEIVSLFSGGPSLSITDLVDSLNRVSPMNSSKWSSIKY
ncbi:DUF4835 family protein [Flavobacterium sp.]|uniref:type IX secretion system protein PorD n=1 Tax=Flavobacterium sp. TaxID=239 RepID=UPI00286EE450|nr:DUF4835 family protein [Flavobacterium sp.]